MTGWIALPGRAGPPPAGLVALVLEVALPLRGPVVLLDGRGEGGAALSVFADPASGIAVLCRLAADAARLRLCAPLDLPATGVARLTLGWAGDAPGWSLRLEVPGTGLSRLVRGRGLLPLTPTAVAGMLAAGAGLRCDGLRCDGLRCDGLRCDGAVLWAGLAAGDRMPQPAPWLGPATPIDTPHGPRAAALLRAGDLVTTLAGVRALSGVTRTQTPVAGTLAPIRLRAPWFAQSSDLVVSADQPVMLSGVAVEYLFGEDAVTARAEHLAGHESAGRDARAGVMLGVSLELADDGVILADGCALTVGRCEALHRLEPWEAVPLRLHLGPGLRARAA